MRISTSWAQELGVNAMNAQQVKMHKTQMQLSSGLKILTPGDDPVGSVRTLNLQETIDKTLQYQDNIAITRFRLNTEEGSLSEAENILYRAKELTVQALNDTLTLEDRLAIRAEIDELLGQMVGVANTKDANGEYIFGGDLSKTQPVVWDEAIGSYVYQGGVNQRVIDIASERQVADGDLAWDVFFNIDSVSQAANATVDGVQVDKRSIFDTLQTLSKALGSAYEVPNATLTGDRFMRYGIDYSTVPAEFDLVSDTGSVTVTLNQNYASLEEVVDAINADPNVALAGVQARSNGNRIEFISSTEGESSSIAIYDRVPAVGSFLTDFGFVDAQTANGVDLGGQITGKNQLSFPLDYSVNNATFELNDEAGNSVEITLDAVYNTAQELTDAIQLAIDADPDMAGQVKVIAASNPIQFAGISSGGGASVQINQVTGTFLTDAGFTSGDTGRIFNLTGNDVLADLDEALDNFLLVRATVGARMRALDDQEGQNDKFVLDMRTTLSAVKDLDYVEAISRFNIEQTALQAAQQAFSRVQNLSLFNYL
jgi:flagellar hook-associated protein 3 FlgL